MTASPHTCWLCESQDTTLLRHGTAGTDLSPQDFRITDSHYGVTLDIYRCANCDFLFCPDVNDPLAQYQAMDDPEYEASREERVLQCHKLLDKLLTHVGGGLLVDVGAGSGVMVEAALARGLDAIGVEPSESLAQQAAQRQLPVECKVLSELTVPQKANLVTLIDVIEHVDDPRQLLADCVAQMADDAVCVMVTPDVDSLCARLLGKRWWHYRIAHIAYFNRKTLQTLLDSAGLEIIEFSRPGWYFPASYLFNRIMTYLPSALRISAPGFLDNMTIPLNLFDSMMVICRRKATASDYSSSK
jgi:2-polyprenyl-3-methyl-5-hydroxy-6-metoxy-1,4-benzoquinol methylase